MKPNKAERQRFDDFRKIGCVICGNLFSEIHHIRHSGKRDHLKTLQLCFAHHRGHGAGVSIHDGLASWVDRYGTEMALLERVNEVI